MSETHNLVPISVPGELYIGGAGVTRGYLNRAELTGERFIGNPFVTEEDKAKGYTQLYKTGDRVRWLLDGNLEYLGRNDFQVKIRGFRIELGKIVSQLALLEWVKDSLVLAREDNQDQNYLVAYIITDQAIREDKLHEKLRDHLQAVLPDYMAPSTFVRLDNFPLTENGKINRKALPKPKFVDFPNIFCQ